MRYVHGPYRSRFRTRRQTVDLTTTRGVASPTASFSVLHSAGTERVFALPVRQRVVFTCTNYYTVGLYRTAYLVDD